MTVEWNKPTSASLYNGEFIQQLSARINQAATLFADPDASSTPTDAVRWNATNKRFEKWNGSTWVDLMSGGLALGGGLTVSGDVGIGTSSPGVKLHVYANGASANSKLESSGASDTYWSFVSGNGDRPAGTEALVGLAGAGTQLHLWDRAAKNIIFGTNDTERARISSSGQLLVGTSTASGGGAIKAVFGGHASTAIQIAASGGGGGAIQAPGDGGIGFLTYTGAVGSESYIERARIDASGNFGLGVTPSAWASGGQFQLGNGSAIAFSGPSGIITANAYWNSAWKRIASGAVAMYDQQSGVHTFYTAASDDAGSAISWTTAMSLSGGGDLRVTESVLSKAFVNDVGTTGTVVSGGVVDFYVGGNLKARVDSSGVKDGSGNLYAKQSDTLGYTQTWQYVTGSRALNTTYTNTTGKPISVAVVSTNTATTAQLQLLVDSIQVASEGDSDAGLNTGVTFFVTGIVPPGSTYRVIGTAMSLSTWAELR